MTDNMTGSELRMIQAQLGVSNVRPAKWPGRSVGTISNYRAEPDNPLWSPIPEAEAKLFAMLRDGTLPEEHRP